MQASEARNKAITASALDCILAVAETGRVLEFNLTAERTFGYREEFRTPLGVRKSSR